jgi:PadR family transcriptional regulator PadR
MKQIGHVSLMKSESSRELSVFSDFQALISAENSPLDNLVEDNVPLDHPEEHAAMTDKPDKPSELIQGTLEMLILKTLALESMHGYGIALRIEQISKGVFRVNPGSLFPALTRLERTGRIKAEWRATENNRRAKYYLLTDRGRKALKEETQQWSRQLAAITNILEA